jgi:uncharacterized protein YcbX
VQVESVWRYPVKSMLGEQVGEAEVPAGGVVGDRRFAVVDQQTGTVASAKQPRLWRRLLSATAEHVDGTVHVHLPGEVVLSLDDPEAHARLSTFLRRAVRVSSTPEVGADIDRADPEEVLAQGVGAEVSALKLVLGQAVPDATFLDYAPLHLITSATLEHIGTPPARYRPNLVLRTPPGTAPYCENEWVGSTLTIGEVVLSVVLPTPRCSVPVLAHGSLPPDATALRVLMAENRVEVTGFGVLPAAGVYASVVQAGSIAAGTTARL